MALSLSKFTLFFLSAAGFWTLWGFPYTNGLLKILTDLQKPGARLLNTDVPMKTKYTGISPVDNQLTTLVGFFYSATDGNRPDVSLIGLNLGGQVIAAWILMVLESMRKGNSGLSLTFVTILGFLMQSIGFACIAPLWMILHLAKSPTVDGEKVHDIVANPVQIVLAPISVVIGYIVPSVVMCLAAPTTISFETKETWTAIQQGWPLWIYISQHLLTFLVQVASEHDTGFEDEDIDLIRRRLRLAYGFGILSSASGHLISWFLSILAYVFPIIFNSSFANTIQPFKIFLPEPPFPPTKANTLGDGALWFLQWDLLIGSTSALLWALTLRTTAKREEATVPQLLGYSLIAGAIALVAGPAGCAVIAIWSRDELVFKRNEAKREWSPKKTR